MSPVPFIQCVEAGDFNICYDILTGPSTSSGRTHRPHPATWPGCRGAGAFGVQGEAAGEDFVAGGVGPAVASGLLAAVLFFIVDDSRSLEDIVDELGVCHRSYFRRTRLNPLIRAGVVAMTRPDRPNHPDQAYALTDAGAALKARRADGG